MQGLGYVTNEQLINSAENGKPELISDSACIYLNVTTSLSLTASVWTIHNALLVLVFKYP